MILVSSKINMRTELQRAKTKNERQQVKTELARNFDRWILMTDEELMTEAKQTFSALTGTPDRGFLLKYLMMNHLDRID